MTSQDELTEAVAAMGALPMPLGHAAPAAPEPLALSEELLDTLVDAGNGALSDYYHERACACSEYPAGCTTRSFYRRGAGHWDTDAFAIGLGAVLAVWESVRPADDALRAERDAFREQRNAVFKTNEELLTRIERIGLERLQTQNEFMRVAREADRLRARVAELEAAAEPVTFGVRPTANALDVRLKSTNREFVEEQLASLRGTYPEAALVQFDSRHCAWVDVPGVAVEDPHDSPLPHTYRVSRDLPEVPHA